MISVISIHTSLDVTDVLRCNLVEFPSALQNEICDRAYDYIYYRLGRVYVENDRANTLLACVYDLHDEYLDRRANRSLASGSFLPEIMTYGLNRRRQFFAPMADDMEIANFV